MLMYTLYLLLCAKKHMAPVTASNLLCTPGFGQFLLADLSKSLNNHGASVNCHLQVFPLSGYSMGFKSRLWLGL